jgi:hypothetical protein
MNAAPPVEAGAIFAHALARGEMPPADKSYLDQLVSAKTGLPQPDADKRVSDVFSSALQNLEATRKATAHTLLWVFLALLIGAFSASFNAIYFALVARCSDPHRPTDCIIQPLTFSDYRLVLTR